MDDVIQFFGGTEIKRIDDRRSFKLEMNAFNLGSSSLVYNQFRTDTEIKIGLNLDYTFFIIGRGVPCRIYVDNEPVVVSPQKAAVLARGRKVQIERPKNSEAIVLRASSLKTRVSIRVSITTNQS